MSSGKKNRELEETIEILKAATTFFVRERPATSLICTFIAEHRARFGVVPICRVLTEHGCADRPENVLRLAQPRAPRNGPCGT